VSYKQRTQSLGITRNIFDDYTAAVRNKVPLPVAFMENSRIWHLASNAVVGKTPKEAGDIRTLCGKWAWWGAPPGRLRVIEAPTGFREWALLRRRIEAGRWRWCVDCLERNT
jgi:hypothetical protein